MLCHVSLDQMKNMFMAFWFSKYLAYEAGNALFISSVMCLSTTLTRMAERCGRNINFRRMCRYITSLG